MSQKFRSCVSCPRKPFDEPNDCFLLFVFGGAMTDVFAQRFRAVMNRLASVWIFDLFEILVIPMIKGSNFVHEFLELMRPVCPYEAFIPDFTAICTACLHSNRCCHWSCPSFKLRLND